jgi:hypothetical protein
MKRGSELNMSFKYNRQTKRRIVRPLAIGCVIGVAGAAAWMVFCFWVSRLPLGEVSPVALARAFDPWWRWWPIAVCFSVTCWIAGIVAEIRGAFVVLQARESARLRMKTSAAKSSL